MSVLQISLIVLAVLAVAGVGVYNWLQERKYRKQWAATFGRGPEQVARDPVDGEALVPDDEVWSEPRLVDPITTSVSRDSSAVLGHGADHFAATDVAEAGWQTAPAGATMVSIADDAQLWSLPEAQTISEAPVLQPAPLNPAPLNPAPLNPAPLNPAPLNPAPLNPAPLNPAPLKPAPLKPALPVGSDTSMASAEPLDLRALNDRMADLPSPHVDALLDFVISLHTLEAIPSTAFTDLMEHWRKEHHAAHWLAYQPDVGKWVEISPWRHQHCVDAVVAVQLADRQGAVSEGLLQQLLEQLRILAARFDGIVRWEDMAPALVRAGKIDQFCLEVDVLIGLNVVAEGTCIFSGADIDRLAQAAGMVLDDTGVYQRMNERREVLYTLRNHEDTPFVQEQMANLVTHGVTLLFEVPRIENGVAVFAEMTHLAQHMAQVLGGRLVDDAIRPLSAAGIEKIQTQLVRRYQLMEAFDVPAGSRRALRLFN